MVCSCRDGGHHTVSATVFPSGDALEVRNTFAAELIKRQ